MARILDPKDPYYIDNPARVKAIQKAMHAANIDVYLGSRIRTLSWVIDAFCPWRSYIVIPPEGDPTVFTFIIDAIRLGDETWLDEDHVRAYAPMGGMDQISAVSDFIKDDLGLTKGRLGYEDGMATYTAEGNLSHYEYSRFSEALPGFTFINSHELIDELSIIKDQGTINRFRKASLIVDEGHKACREALENGGYKGITEAVIGGIAALAMRKAGSVSEWNFAGLNEISTGYRTGLGACTPPTNKVIQAGDPLMLDLHAMFQLALGDHSHNYLINPATKRQRWHADNFVALVQLVLDSYRAGTTPAELAQVMMDCAESRGCADFTVPGCEHGIGLFGDEWRIGGRNDGPMPYWTDPDHVYQENEMVVCAMQYACPAEGIGFRYENDILILKDGCEFMSKYPLAIEEIG
ncbi:MAG: M24 family metallopeptidase [Syntrophaceae bacterium]